MRKPIIGGNWKMNRGTPQEAFEMLKKLVPMVRKVKEIDIVIAPPFTVINQYLSSFRGIRCYSKSRWYLLRTIVQDSSGASQ